ncbi:MAG: exopolysaccharide biosynthesis protein [Acidobacteria bacterium]|nr:MAG: exopolysaccharide biosynthesis protein [Acidobacteriota bacterium]
MSGSTVPKDISTHALYAFYVPGRQGAFPERSGQILMSQSRHKFVLGRDSLRNGPHTGWARNRGSLGLQRSLKRCLDLLGAAVLILLLLPVFVIVGLLVAFQEGRPILYRRRVLGIRDEFDAFKFRTMIREADAVLASNPALKAEFERNFKLKDDPRVTRLGAFLRKISLDELPQLFNVLRGQMSLVGPRMITAAELDKYGPPRILLLSTKPGLTGYWQVRGRQNVSYEERMRMDAYYIENWSLWMDLKILFATPLKVLKSEGAF